MCFVPDPHMFEKGLPRTLSAQIRELVTHFVEEPARMHLHGQKQSKREQLHLSTIRAVTCCELGNGWETALWFKCISLRCQTRCRLRRLCCNSCMCTRRGFCGKRSKTARAWVELRLLHSVLGCFSQRQGQPNSNGEPIGEDAAKGHPKNLVSSRQAPCSLVSLLPLLQGTRRLLPSALQPASPRSLPPRTQQKWWGRAGTLCLSPSARTGPRRKADPRQNAGRPRRSQAGT